jgi:hypothetical protein
LKTSNFASSDSLPGVIHIPEKFITYLPDGVDISFYHLSS